MADSDLKAADELRSKGKPDEALEKLDKASKDDQATAPHQYTRGRALEELGRYEEAAEAYQKALEADAEYRPARFRMGFLADLRGDEETAVECYEQCIKQAPTDIASLLNLGTIYETRGYIDSQYYDRAIECYERIIDLQPNNARARLALRDVQAAQVMYYDEEQERRRDQRNQVLEIPVTDFELSVRSRNCLKKMNIRTLGDLIMHTDKDLLSYKNFGETSLAEIKEMLTSKGLYLGMGLEQQTPKPQAAPQPTPVPQPSPSSSAAADIPLDSIEFSVRARKCFERLGIETLGELADKTEPDLLGTKNFGQTSLNEIKQKLNRYGLSLAD